MPGVKLLTYNILMKPSEYLVYDYEFKKQRCQIFCSRFMKNFDIICLQETYDNFHMTVNALLEGAARNGFDYFVQGSQPALFSKFLINSGLTILSKFRILDSEEIIFQPGLDLDSMAQQGALYAKIQVDYGKILHLINVHPQAHYCHHGEEKVYSYKVRRFKQLVELKRFVMDIMNKHYEPGDLAIMCGDFNVDWNTEEDFYDFDRILTILDDQAESLKQHFTSEYDLLMRLFEWSNEQFDLINIHLQQNGHQAVTFADYTVDENGKKIPKEQILTNKLEQCYRNGFDYIFEISVKGSDYTNLKIVPGSCNVETFEVENTPAFTQLSDHYGISVNII